MILPSELSIIKLLLFVIVISSICLQECVFPSITIRLALRQAVRLLDKDKVVQEFVFLPDVSGESI